MKKVTCEDAISIKDEPILTNDTKNFIKEVSKGYLTVRHECTYQLVRIGLCFVKKTKHRACCRKRHKDSVYNGHVL